MQIVKNTTILFDPSLVVVHSYVLHAAFGDATQAVNSVDSVV